VLRHADAPVCPLLLHRLSRNFPHPLLLISAATPTIPMAFPPRLPKLCSDPHYRLNPIAHRVRRKRQRLPPSLLIENASVQLFSLSSTVLSEAFPIKASDHSPRRWHGDFARGIPRCTRSFKSRVLYAVGVHPEEDEVDGSRVASVALVLEIFRKLAVLCG
jgi:hypothetical protein